MSQHPRRRRATHGDQIARARPEAPIGPGATSISQDTVEWPTVGWEPQRWFTPGAGGLTRRERESEGSREYFSSIPAVIAIQQLSMPGVLLADLDEATARIAGYDGESRSLPAPLLGVLLRSESASSSQIEQITASARAIAEAELTGVGSGNAEVIAANVHAMTESLQHHGPITAAGIETIQRSLMCDQPRFAGWRDDPVWIGGGGSSPLSADFVPPDHRRIPDAMQDLTEFIARNDLPVLAQAAVAHAQFETIHPFADGNGRTGRALVHLILREKELATSSIVPLSSGLLADKQGYFEALTAYRNGDAGPIVSVFSRAALHAVHHGQRLAARVATVQQEWRNRITARSDSAVWRVIAALPEHPVFDAEGMARAVDADSRNIHRQLRKLVDEKIIVGRQHHKSHRYLFRAPDLLGALDDYAADFGRRPQ